MDTTSAVTAPVDAGLLPHAETALASATPEPTLAPSEPTAPDAPARVNSLIGRRWVRRLVGAWLLYHVVGIIVAPAAVNPSSGLMQSSWRLFRPYLQFFYLNHGFHFFAPEPSSSTLVGYTLEFPDGSTQTGRFPNRGIQPRLMYHRHFMLTEFLGFVPDEEEGAWHRSYARHLGKTYGATHVSLSRITHYLPTPDAVAKGAGLNESDSFAEVPLGRFACDEL